MDPLEDEDLLDESYLSKQLEAQVGLKKKLVHKYNMAKDLCEIELKKRQAAKEQLKIEAYNNWRAEEIEKGRLQDEHSKNLVKIMKEAAKTAPSTNFYLALSNVIANIDGNKNIVLNMIAFGS